MSDEQRYNDILDKLQNLKRKVEDIERDVRHEMEIKHIEIHHRLIDHDRDIKLHRHIFATVAGVIGLAVLGAVLKVIGL